MGIAPRGQEVGEVTEGPLDVWGVGVGLELEDEEGIGAAGGEEALDGKVDAAPRRYAPWWRLGSRAPPRPLVDKRGRGPSYRGAGAAVERQEMG